MKNRIVNILCLATLGVFFLIMFQGKTRFFPIWELEGVTNEVKRPKLTFDEFYNGQYQTHLEEYLRNNIGFREIMIRLFNQYLWDFYHKSYSNEVAIGKYNWLYFNFNVNEYYGKEMYRWVSKDDAVERFTREIRILNKLRNVLKSYGIEFMIFTSPDKADLYPQYLPEREFDTTTIHAYNFYREEFARYDFPYIDMNSWFKDVQDTLDYPAIPQASAHWVFPSVYAADSLFRFMANEKGVTMPQIKIGGKIKNSKETEHVIRDLEFGLNLLRPIKLSDYEYYEREINILADSNTVKMNAIFVGNSFFRAFNQYLPLNEIFNEVHYWFYNMTDFYGPNLHKSTPIGETDRLYEIINSDYIVWFTDNAQMYKISYGFAEDALIKLCVSDSLWNAEVYRYADSLHISQWDATLMLQNNPELIKGLDTDNPTIRNTKAINEARNLYQARHSSEAMLYEYKVEKMIEEIKSKPDLMEMIRQKAKDNNVTLEEMIERDARWIVDHQEN